MKLILIDDEPPALRLLTQLLKKTAPACVIAATCGSLKEGVVAVQNHQPDLVFLDVEMPQQTGLDISSCFSGPLPFQVIFTTAHAQFAARAFEINATDYLLKPLTEQKVAAALRKAEEKQLIQCLQGQSLAGGTQARSTTKRLLLPVANGMEILCTDEISFLKAEGSYTVLHLTNGKTMMASKNLKYFEQVLTINPSFFRVHRSFLANLNKARKIIHEGGTELLFENGSRIPIATERIDSVLLALVQA